MTVERKKLGGKPGATELLDEARRQAIPGGRSAPELRHLTVQHINRLLGVCRLHDLPWIKDAPEFVDHPGAPGNMLIAYARAFDIALEDHRQGEWPDFNSKRAQDRILAPIPALAERLRRVLAGNGVFAAYSHVFGKSEFEHLIEALGALYRAKPMLPREQESYGLTALQNAYERLREDYRSKGLSEPNFPEVEEPEASKSKKRPKPTTHVDSFASEIVRVLTIAFGKRDALLSGSGFPKVALQDALAIAFEELGKIEPALATSHEDFGGVYRRAKQIVVALYKDLNEARA